MLVTTTGAFATAPPVSVGAPTAAFPFEELAAGGDADDVSCGGATATADVSATVGGAERLVEAVDPATVVDVASSVPSRWRVFSSEEQPSIASSISAGRFTS